MKEREKDLNSFRFVKDLIFFYVPRVLCCVFNINYFNFSSLLYSKLYRRCDVPSINERHWADELLIPSNVQNGFFDVPCTTEQ